MIDWAQVKQLEDDVGAEDFGEVIEIFLEEVEETIDKLRSSDALDQKEVEPTMHFLKGSALNLGFVDFAKLCADGEQKAKDGYAETVTIPEIVTLYDQSKQAFISDVGNHTSFAP